MLVEQCALMHIFFRKRPGCVLIGVLSLIRTPMRVTSPPKLYVFIVAMAKQS